MPGRELTRLNSIKLRGNVEHEAEAVGPHQVANGLEDQGVGATTTRKPVAESVEAGARAARQLGRQATHESPQAPPRTARAEPVMAPR